MVLINKKVFFLEDKGEHYIINFETNEIIKANPRIIKNLKSNKLSPLMTKHFKLKKILVNPQKKPSYTFKPKSVIFYPNFKCNMRCKYCCIDENTNPQEMSLDAAKKAIDLVVENLRKEGMNTLNLQFTGGGEPTLSFDLIKDIIIYSKKVFPYNHILKIVTNGLVPEHKLKWLVDNDFEIYVSFDGLPEAQDFQRILPNGKGSFKLVDKTLKLLQNWKAKFLIRSVVSEKNVDDLKKMVDFIATYGPRKIVLIPMVIDGRAAYTPDIKVIPEKKLYKALLDLGFYVNKNKNVKVSINNFIDKNLQECNSDINNDSNTSRSHAPSLILTPENFVSFSSFLISTKRKHHDKVFFGEFKDGKLIIDQEKYSKIMKTADKINKCQNCIVKHICCAESKFLLLYSKTNTINCHMLQKSMKRSVINEFVKEWNK